MARMAQNRFRKYVKSMKVKGIDGKLYIWNPIGNTDLSREISSYHSRARIIVRSLFPSERILEEVGLPGTWPMLYADIIIPLRKFVVEAHGPQHYKFIPYFHGTQREFIEGKKRDEKKRNWCEINNFYYIELPYWENDDEWRYRILNFGEPGINRP